METEECISTRRTVRKFKSTTVDMEKIGKILEAGRSAPSSGNIQNWMFIIVDDENKRKAIAEACFQQYWMAAAPVHLVVCIKPQEVKRHYGIRGERLYSIQNAAAATENMILMANSQGLGSCWVSAFDEDKVKRVISAPDNVRPQAIITLGYPDEQVPSPPKYPIEIVFYFNKWRGRIKDVAAYFGRTSVHVEKGINKGKEMLDEGMKKITDKEKKKRLEKYRNRPEVKKRMRDRKSVV